MRHYNKAVFSVKHIGCDGEFKLIINEMSNDMGIEINSTNTDDCVPEVDKNNRLIKERFRTAYYWFPYKKIIIIIISHMTMNVT